MAEDKCMACQCPCDEHTEHSCGGGCHCDHCGHEHKKGEGCDCGCKGE